VVSLGGRIRALEPRSGESAEDYRGRVEPMLANAALFETARHAFESFVARVETALRTELPGADVTQKRAEARLVKAPERAPAAPDRAPPSPMHPAYDPFLVYYSSPMYPLLDAMMFASFMHMMMPPHITVVSPSGAPLGDMSDIQADPHLADDGMAGDVGSDYGHDDGDLGGDDFSDPTAGGWDGGFDGGDFDGGDFGGGFD
jgi:hypothetical protein